MFVKCVLVSETYLKLLIMSCTSILTKFQPISVILDPFSHLFDKNIGILEARASGGSQLLKVAPLSNIMQKFLLNVNFIMGLYTF